MSYPPITRTELNELLHTAMEGMPVRVARGLQDYCDKQLYIAFGSLEVEGTFCPLYGYDSELYELSSEAGVTRFPPEFDELSRAKLGNGAEKGIWEIIE